MFTVFSKEEDRRIEYSIGLYCTLSLAVSLAKKNPFGSQEED
jgi:hypothetical protein